MQQIIKYITTLLTLAILALYPLSAADTTSLQCKDVEQENNTKSPWACPELGSNNTKMNAILSDVDVESGRYTCEYHFVDSGALATACSYFSKNYKEALDDTREMIKDNIGGAIDKSGDETIKPFLDYYKNTIGEDALDSFQELKDDFPELDSLLDVEYNLRSNKKYGLHQRIQDIISGDPEPGAPEPKNLREYITMIEGAAVDGYVKKLNLTGDNIKNPIEALEYSYELFVKPYTPKHNTNDEGKLNFSKFVTGMVTLDTDVVNGYLKDGKLSITDKWKDGAKSPDKSHTKDNINIDFWEIVKRYFLGQNNATNDANTDIQKITTWADIFTQKIWGFYYNLQRRLDLGYDIISTQLLFIVMMFFAVGMAARGGARYITNRENGHSSGEVKINEASIMKTLGILATVFAFYISVPSDYDKTTPSATEKTDHNNEEMRTSQSLAKFMIRTAMTKGADFGTMMADLGTDAFLHYLVDKQGLDNKERKNVIESMMSMAYYFPAYQIVNTCRMQYGSTDISAASASNSVAVSKFFNDNYEKNINLTSRSLAGNDTVQVEGLSDRLCRKMYGRTVDKLEEVATDFEILLAMIKKDMYVRMNATYSIVHNHIMLQEELGWMNIASVPYSYFMMKNMHLFYETSVDYAAIQEKTKDYASNLGLRDSTDSLNDTLWAKDLKESKLRITDATSAAKSTQEEYTRYAVYNFLPGFNSIRNEVLQRVQSLYSDILRLRQNKKVISVPAGGGASRQSDKPDNAKLEKFEDLLNKMVTKANDYYKTHKLNLDSIRKHIKLGINGGNQDPVELHQAFIKISYLMAMAIWKSGFIIVFLSAIAMIIGIKIVLYVINVMVHFFISPFIVVWAFASSADGGMGKIKNYLRDTLIYMLYPTMIVIGVFMFIFAYELFYSIYGFITSMLIEGQEKNISSAIIAAKSTPAGGSYTLKDGEMGYLAIYSLKDITEILIDLLSVYVAFMTINKFPELVLKMMGITDSAVIMLPQASEAIQSKGGGSVNPLSR